ncbi:MAG: glycosyltransferase family 4 protein [Planctomycetes bacterium]|nr:glycosyltransferase family 4 protein [Planctomycetota bacterium]MBM4085201.1 glycosyltransferase family 4 protein [Planctomycetota bacterium]
MPARKTHVLHVHNYSTWGGNIEHISLLAKGLNPSRYAVWVAGPMRLPYMARLRDMGIQVVHSEIRQQFDPAAVAHFLRLFRGHRIDIIHTHIRPADFHGGLAAMLARNVLAVCTLHGKVNTDELGQQHDDLAAQVYSFALRRFFDRVLTVSEALRREALDITGAKPERFVHVTNGIDLSRFKALAPRAVKRRELGLDDGDLAVGMMSRFVSNESVTKGHPEFFAAARAVLSRVPTAKFVLIGDGVTRPAYQQRVQADGLADRFLFLGHRDDVPDVLAALDVSVLPSLGEGLPRALMESMAAGVPVIGTELDGIVELLDRGRVGLLVPPRNPEALANAMFTLLTQREQAKRLAAEGRHRVEAHYSKEHMIAETERVYEGLLAARRKLHP